MISKRDLRKKIKKKWDGEVSEDGLDYLKTSINKIIDSLVEEAVNEVKETNKIREKAKLPEIKRIPKSIFINLLVRIFKETKSLENCEVGNYPRDKPLPYKADMEVIQNV